MHRVYYKYWVAENWGNLQTKYICQGERNMKNVKYEESVSDFIGEYSICTCNCNVYPAE